MSIWHKNSEPVPLLLQTSSLSLPFLQGLQVECSAIASAIFPPTLCSLILLETSTFKKYFGKERCDHFSCIFVTWLACELLISWKKLEWRVVKWYYCVLFLTVPLTLAFQQKGLIFPFRSFLVLLGLKEQQPSKVRIYINSLGTC